MKTDKVTELRRGNIVKGAAILGAAALISKLIGTLQKIPLQNVAGDTVFGIYNTVYPFYVLLLFISTAGVPIAVSKMVTERRALGDREGALDVIRVSAAILTITGVLVFGMLYFGADGIALLIGNSQTAPAIRSVSFALLLVPLMSVLRGYFQGLNDMVPTAVSQVAEQFIRVGTMVALMFWFIHAGYGDASIAAGATFGSVTGGAAGLAVMLYYWHQHRRLDQLKGIGAWTVEGRRPLAARALGRRMPLAKQILAYAIPICLGSIALPILSIADTFTLPRLFAMQGMSELAAMDAFGVYNRGLPLTQLVAMLVSSVSVAVVPAIAAAKLIRDEALVKDRAETALRLTWLVTLAASVGLAVLAEPINVMLYTNAAGSRTLAILAFTAVFSSLNIISGALLQGAGNVKAPAVHLGLAAAAKISLNIVLIPLWGIEGAAIAAVAAFALAAALNLRALAKHTGARFSPRRYLLRPGAAALAMAAALFAFRSTWNAFPAALAMPPRLEMTALALLSIALGALVYGAAVFGTRAVTEAELARFPALSGKLLPLLRKLRLL
ncbi:hypothetical protein SY83_06480 [Paenibacillus swuensis]|uniref:Uncharacterized protein n=1 Tax=Paenibacillus swuensis TaxID=1178515 RepID=A0A172TGH9_9BACL|nr:oligosaccharide flippase family protein [Paenibacillus swuensis]ANE45987.1 hypothetical protein SY83_06480 [Paenibacillus swuensis]